MGRVKRAGTAAAVGLLAPVLLSACGDTTSSAHPVPGVALEIAVQDDGLNGDVQLDARVVDGLDDHTLDSNTVVSSNPVLLRVAQLVFEGKVDINLAKLAEEQRWRKGEELSLDAAMTQAGFDQADLDNYVRLTAEPPVSGSNEKYVVYAAARHMDIFFVIYAQVDQLSTGRTSNGRYPTVSTWIAGSEGITDVTFPETDCTT